MGSDPFFFAFSFLFPFSLEGANLTKNCAKLTELKTISADYVYHYFYSTIGRNEIETKTVGGVQGKLPSYNIAAFQILIPDASLLEYSSAKFSKLGSNKKALRSGSNCLEKMQKTLLAKMTKVDA